MEVEEEEEEEKEWRFRAVRPELEMVFVGGFAAAQTPAEGDGIAESVVGGEIERRRRWTYKSQQIADLFERKESEFRSRRM